MKTRVVVTLIVILVAEAYCAVDVSAGISLSWNEGGIWIWYDDPATHTVFSNVGCDGGDTYHQIDQAPPEDQLFLSLDQFSTVYFSQPPVEPGKLRFYYRAATGVPPNEAFATFQFQVRAPCAWVTPVLNVVGQLSPEEAGPFSGTVAGVSQYNLGLVCDPYTGNCQFLQRTVIAGIPRYFDWSQWGFGVYNIGRQMSGGNWISGGSHAVRATYDPGFWTSQADVLIPELVGYSGVLPAMESAADSGKVVIIPGAAFDLFVSETSAEVHLFVFGEVTLEFVGIGDGGIINGNGIDRANPMFNWTKGAGRFRWPNVVKPVDHYLTLAKALNHLTYGIQTGQVFNQPPIADAGPDQYLEADEHCAALAFLDGSGSSDPDGDQLNYFWDSTLGPATGVNVDYQTGLGDTMFSLYVDDGQETSDLDYVTVFVSDQTPPILNGPPSEIVVECSSPLGSDVDLPTVSAIDNCDDVVEVSNNTSGPFPLGSTTVNYTSADIVGNTASANLVVTVVDTVPPSVSQAVATPDYLWSPNHDMRAVTVAVTSSDNCDSSPPGCFVSSVHSDQPELGCGSGNHAPDITISGEMTVEVRAERCATINAPRLYTVIVSCSDASSNVVDVPVVITVPHDQGG